MMIDISVSMMSMIFLHHQELCVLGLKLLIQEESGLKPEEMRLVMDNNQLEDGRLDAPMYIRDISGLINGGTIHLVLKSGH